MAPRLVAPVRLPDGTTTVVGAHRCAPGPDVDVVPVISQDAKTTNGTIVAPVDGSVVEPGRSAVRPHDHVANVDHPRDRYGDGAVNS